MGTDDARRNAAAMLVFAEVVATGSFTEAARRLGLSKASVSREVARLERRLGAQLLRRTTRSMSLTEVGEVFHAGCQRVVEEAEQAERSVGSATRVLGTRVGLTRFSTTSRSIMTRSTSLRLGRSYMVLRRTSSMIARKPRAPVDRFSACSAIPRRCRPSRAGQSRAWTSRGR